jgi:hypothetical protein
MAQTYSNALQVNNNLLVVNAVEVANLLIQPNLLEPNEGTAQAAIFPGNAPVTG